MFRHIPLPVDREPVGATSGIGQSDEVAIPRIAERGGLVGGVGDAGQIAVGPGAEDGALAVRRDNGRGNAVCISLDAGDIAKAVLNGYEPARAVVREPPEECSCERVQSA